MQLINSDLKIMTTFHESADTAHAIFYASCVRSALKKMFPKELLHKDCSEGELDSYCRDMFPLMKWEEWGDGPYHVLITFVGSYLESSGRFLSEMLSHWILPTQRIPIESSLAIAFTLPDLSDSLYFLSEIVLYMNDESSLERARKNWGVLENEIRIGSQSAYQAQRILEMKGLSLDDKTGFIQEFISTLLHKRPKLIDYDIFSQMQHFLVLCKDEFKRIREYQHMSRIIYVFYLFRKELRAQVEMASEKRYVSFKLHRVRLHHPLGIKKVLGLFVGMNFCRSHEVFDERHLLKAVKEYIPSARIIDDSVVIDSHKEDRIQTLYVEIEKEDKQEFTSQELKLIRNKISEDIKDQIEKLMPSIFMPRNEEEVMKNIVMLSHELKYLRDLPQVIISFEEQSDHDLAFTIIYVRLITDPKTLSVIKQLAEQDLKFSYSEDRVKRVGSLRNKYPKEATVLRVKVPKEGYVKENYSVDLVKARKEVAAELSHVLGEFRDYNGGMLAKQEEIFYALKALLGDLPKRNEHLLERFFHSLYPIETRSVINVQCLSTFFQLIQKAWEKDIESSEEKAVFFCEEEEEALYCAFATTEQQAKQQFVDVIKGMKLASSELISLSFSQEGVMYLGCVLLGYDKDKRQELLHQLALCRNFFLEPTSC